jgi:hypothetical protein
MEAWYLEVEFGYVPFSFLDICQLTLRCLQFWNLKEDSARTIDFVWADQKGKRCVDCSIRTTHDPARDFITTMPGNHTSLLYAFSEVNMTSSSYKFWFEIREGKKLTIEDQAGRGFLLNSDVIASSTTCMYREEEARLKVDIAVSCPPHW